MNCDPAGSLWRSVLDGPRRVRGEELDALAELLCRVFGSAPSYPEERVRSGVRSGVQRRAARVIVEDGKPVSHIATIYEHVSIYGCRFRVASIGGVCTEPEYRGRGYAGAILRHSLEEMTGGRAKVLIVSGDRSLYRRAHCVPAGRTFEAEISRGVLEGGDGVTARRTGLDEWPVMAQLHQAEAVRFVRAADFWERLCCWWDCAGPEVWLIEAGGEAMAYVTLTREWEEKPGSRRRVVSEYAGSRSALLEGLPAVFGEAGLDSIRFRVLGHDRELAYMLRRRGIALKAAVLSGTHRLVDLPGLMRRLRPYLAARLPRRELRRLSFDQEGEKCALMYGSERTELALSQAGALVLGGPDAPELSGELAGVLSRVLPVPFPMPGFNYV